MLIWDSQFIKILMSSDYTSLIYKQEDPAVDMLTTAASGLPSEGEDRARIRDQ